MKKIVLLFAIIFYTAATAFGQWTALNATSDDATDSFVSLDVLNENIVFATAVPFQFTSGDLVVHKSSDGGENWATLDIEATNASLSTNYTPISIHAFDENTLWAGLVNLPSSLRGTLVKSNDGGSSWEEVDLPLEDNNEVPTSIHLFSKREGVVFTTVFPFAFNGFYQSQRNSLSDSLQIYYTDDAGDSWENVTPELESDESRWFSQGNAMYDVKGDTIWYGTLNGRVLRSINKGKDWSIFDVNPGKENNINSIAFRDAQNGIVVVASSIANFPAQGFRTTDGGETWSPINMPERIENVYTIPGSGGAYIASMNWSGNSGYFVSKDDGEHWQRVQAPQNLYTFQFLSPDVGFAGGLNSEGGIFKYEGEPLIAEPTEPVPELVEEQGVGLLSEGYKIEDISIVSEDVVWAIARLATIGSPVPSDYVPDVLRTIDGGTTWEIIPMEEATGRFCWQIHAFNDSTAVVTTQNLGAEPKRGVYKTTDGGNNWTEVFNNSAGGVWMHFFNDEEGIVINRQAVAKTFDGGDTWERTTTNILDFRDNEFTIIYFGENSLAASGDHLWFGTNRGRVFHSSDRGESWDVTLVDSGVTIHSVAFKDTLNGLAIGSQRTIYRTEDGGQSWRISPATGFSYDMQSIAYVPGTENTYIATSTYIDFAMLFTNDGGDTWQDIPDVHAFGVIEFDSPSLGWIARGAYAFSESAALYKWVGEPFPEATTTSTHTIMTAIDVQLSPNPASEELNVTAEFEVVPKEVVLTITDVQGKVLESRKVSAVSMLQETIEVEQLPAGIYFLQMQTDKGMLSKKFIKK